MDCIRIATVTPAHTPATVQRVPRPRGELTSARARRLAHLVKARSDAEANLRIEALLALTEDGASFREVSDLTGLSTNTLQRWKRESS